MIFSGLVSITFRNLTPQEIISLVADAQLDAIEWGGDVHVPHGDVDNARLVGKMTVDAGLTVSAYGTYYRVGHMDSAKRANNGAAETELSIPFEAIIDTAIEIGAPQVRVWAGAQGTENEDERYFEQVVKDSQRIAKLAESAGLVVAYEYHGNTLTDSDDAARRLLETVNCESIRSYWQPRRCGTLENDLAGIDAVSPWLTDIHVFSWHPETGERLPLDSRADDWSKYLKKINELPEDRYALLEFVKDDSLATFFTDAAVLKEWLKQP